MQKGLSDRQAAKLVGVSHTAIAKAKQKGWFKILDDGKIDKASLLEWDENRKKKPTTKQQQKPSSLEEKEGRFATLQEATIYKTSYEARLKQLEYDLKSGDVVPIEDVAKAVGAEYSRVRTRLLAIPAEQAPQLFNCQSVNEIQDKLHKLISHVLTELTEDERWNNTILEREEEASNSSKEEH